MWVWMSSKTSQRSPAGSCPIYTLNCSCQVLLTECKLSIAPPLPSVNFCHTLRWQNPWSRKISSWLPHQGLAYSVNYDKNVTVSPDLSCVHIQTMWGAIPRVQKLSQLYSQWIRRRGWRGRKKVPGGKDTATWSHSVNGNFCEYSPFNDLSSPVASLSSIWDVEIFAAEKAVLKRMSYSHSHKPPAALASSV